MTFTAYDAQGNPIVGDPSNDPPEAPSAPRPDREQDRVTEQAETAEVEQKQAEEEFLDVLYDTMEREG